MTPCVETLKRRLKRARIDLEDALDRRVPHEMRGRLEREVAHAERALEAANAEGC